MKKYIFMTLTVVLFGLTACTEDAFDRINKDNEHPSPEAVPAALQLTDAIMSTGFSTVSGDFAFYLSSLNEQEVGMGNNQLMFAEMRNSSEWAASTTFNNVWNSTYGNLQNIRQMQSKIENEVPGNVGQFDILGMAQILEAVNFGVLTDMFGDIPYSEAVQGLGNLQPKLDAQKDVYTGILATLDKAIDNLEKGKSMTNAGNQDIAYKGAASKWLAAAHALKARYLLHKLAVEPNVLSEVATSVQQAIDNGFEGFTVTGFNGSTCDNPWSAYVFSRQYTAPSKTVSSLMEATDDPRLDYYLNALGEAYIPGDETIAKTVDDARVMKYQPTWYLFGSQPIHIMSKAELYFIQAEVQLRSNVDATSAYQKAVEASVTEILTWFGDETTVPAAAATAKAYASSLGAPTLQKLFEQKYVAQALDEQVETYNDLRRLKAMGEEYVILTNPRNAQSGINRYPERLPYGNSAVIGNPNVKKAYGDGSYIYSEKTWINGGK